MMWLNILSKPLHISEAFQWVLIIGVFYPIALTFHYNKKLKKEKKAAMQASDGTIMFAEDSRKKRKKMLLMMMACGVIVGMLAPFWGPITGTTLGFRGDMIVGLITAVISCTIFGIGIARLPSKASQTASGDFTPPAGASGAPSSSESKL
jgi:uncharacterized membrane protein YeaQ/YmgE (transglycosylase-associated protein family)